jgi:hypothetical protein
MHVSSDYDGAVQLPGERALRENARVAAVLAENLEEDQLVLYADLLDRS